ncbi:hypothetical protein VV01_20425 [Luteipulveratus halotolerans]|uniref:DUF4396 domain-containing protein n=2 Tax=Luteipulveratus halotolerans TaxID=1631356 RepID=A0A0L6CPQ7_9MICO|nr:hypothetical protein VV01_20425 [Luteipulveratus halotolerans]
MAASATLHCLTGCSIGEIVGLMIGTHNGWSNLPTTVLSIALAFVFGYSLSALPVVLGGLSVGAALKLVLAADTLSIAAMELVDNAVMNVIPGAMDAGLDRPLFWVSMAIALTAAFAAAYPVNVYLMSRGKGHALTHEFMGHDHAAMDHAAPAGRGGRAPQGEPAAPAGRGGRAPQGEPVSRPDDEHHGHEHAAPDRLQRRTSWTGPSASTLAVGIAGFLLGGLVVSAGAQVQDDAPAPPSHSTPTAH